MALRSGSKQRWQLQEGTLHSEMRGWGVSHLFREFCPATKGFGSHRVGQSPISARLGVPGRAGSGSTEPGPSQGRPLAAFFPGSALLPSSPALSVSCPALPPPPGWFSIALKPALAAAKAGTGRVCSISTPAWCEELPRCPAPAELVGQKVPFSAGPVACAHSLQPVLSLVQSFPGLRFTSSRTASSPLLGVLD